MRITFLGTGTSMGIPMIGCRCQTCTSQDPRDTRLRTSLWIEVGDKNIVIDTGIDFRAQALKWKIQTVDTVLFTHPHVDHIFGLDELRPINFLQKKTVQVFSDAQTLNELKRIYPYVFDSEGCPSDIPKINHKTFNNKPFRVGEIAVTPIPLLHGNLPITGFKIGTMAYCTDVSFIPDESYDLLKNLDVLILGALRDTPHPTHFNLKEAEKEAQKINAKKTYFVHMSHELCHSAMLQRLPSNMVPAYDGLQINLTDKH